MSSQEKPIGPARRFALLDTMCIYSGDLWSGGSTPHGLLFAHDNVNPSALGVPDLSGVEELPKYLAIDRLESAVLRGVCHAVAALQDLSVHWMVWVDEVRPRIVVGHDDESERGTARFG